ncbi:MAG: GNAT family N-acetyltransferase [Proteobacteria bacterium]|nr:GNAT family N-acetyltransferase [Pseudomonadota bacterium]
MAGVDWLITEGPPTVAEYARLRQAVGWPPVDPRAASAALNASLFAVRVALQDDVIGMGRIIGDGGLYFYVQDVMILPEHQKGGLGRRIMQTLTRWLDDHAPPGAFVGLMAARGAAGFYRRHGFAERPPDAPGMFRIEAPRG